MCSWSLWEPIFHSIHSKLTFAFTVENYLHTQCKCSMPIENTPQSTCSVDVEMTVWSQSLFHALNTKRLVKGSHLCIHSKAHYQGYNHCQFRNLLFYLRCLALIITLNAYILVNHSPLDNYIYLRLCLYYFHFRDYDLFDWWLGIWSTNTLAMNNLTMVSSLLLSEKTGL